jgi:hypothetical protein
VSRRDDPYARGYRAGAARAIHGVDLTYEGEGEEFWAGYNQGLEDTLRGITDPQYYERGSLAN